MPTEPSTTSSRPVVELTRSYPGTCEEAWALWTTRAGLESWWGPEGFTVSVQSLDLRPGGELHYTMIATGADQIAYVEQAGLPVATPAQITFTEVDAPHHLGYRHRVDFIPQVVPYDFHTTVDLLPTESGVTLQLRIETMHDDEWTERALAGWRSELDKLAAVLTGQPPNQRKATNN